MRGRQGCDDICASHVLAGRDGTQQSVSGLHLGRLVENACFGVSVSSRHTWQNAALH